MRRVVLGLMFCGALLGAGCGDDDFGAERYPMDLSVASDALGDQAVPSDLSATDIRSSIDHSVIVDMAIRDGAVDGGGDLSVIVDATLIDSAHGE